MNKLTESEIREEAARLLDKWTQEVLSLADAAEIEPGAVWARVNQLREARAAAAAVEVRLPDSGWIKRVTAVPANAKTGYDWRGDMLQIGRLVDLAPGSLLAWGGKDNPTDLGVVQADGSIDWFGASDTGEEWAIKLRALAIEWLTRGESGDAKRLGKAQEAARKAHRTAAREAKEIADKVKDLVRLLQRPVGSAEANAKTAAELAEAEALAPAADARKSETGAALDAVNAEIATLAGAPR